MSIGWIGLGAMGRPLAVHLVKAGYALTVHDLDSRATDELESAGAKVVGNARDLGGRCEIVFASLPNWHESERVCVEILAGSKRPRIYVELSTLPPSAVRALAIQADSKGTAFVDAPVSGTAIQRTEGTMTVFCGANPLVFDEIRPIASSFAKNIFLLGPVGSGSVAKVCNQLMTMTGLIAATEGLELGVRHGLALEPLQEAIMCSSGSARSLALIAREYVHRTYRTLTKPRAALRLAVKDLEQVVELAREVGLRVELAEAALAIWRRAEEAGLGDADIYTYIDHFQSWNP